MKSYLSKLHHLCSVNSYVPRNIFDMDESWVDSSGIRNSAKVVGTKDRYSKGR